MPKGVNPLANYLDPERCKRCGECLYSCPVYKLTYKEFDSPRGRLQLINKFRMLNKKPNITLKYIEKIYSCLLCELCTRYCPSGLDIPNIVRNARIELIDNGYLVSEEIDRLASNLRQYGWIYEAKNRKASETTHKKTVIVPGCVALKNNLKIVDSIYKLVSMLNGEKPSLAEDCCGGLLHNAGYTALSNFRSEQMIDLMLKSGVEEIITPCPVGYRNLKKYEDKLKIYYSAEYILRNLKNRSIKPKRVKGKFALHKPCFIRSMDVWSMIEETLREDLKLDFEVVEDACCGGGGGVVYIANRKLSEDLGREFLRSIKEGGFKSVIIECPFGLLNLAKISKEFKIEILSLSEVVERSMKKLLF